MAGFLVVYNSSTGGRSRGHDGQCRPTSRELPICHAQTNNDIGLVLRRAEHAKAGPLGSYPLQPFGVVLGKDPSERSPAMHATSATLHRKFSRQ